MRRGYSLPRHHRAIIALWCAGLVCFALSTVFGSGGLLHLWRIHRQQRALTAYAFSLTRATDRLRGRIARLRNDDTYLETLAREQLGLLRDGEVVYRFAPFTPGSARR